MRSHQSGSRHRVRTAAMVLALAVGVGHATGCGRGQAADGPAPAAPPPSMLTPVGPVPGPGGEPRRPANPFRDDRAAMAEGRRLFVEFNCSGCHGGRAGGGMGPSLRDVSWRYGNSDAQIFSTINEGRDEGMPAWGARLQTDQIWKLVAYVKALRTADEPEAPER